MLWLGLNSFELRKNDRNYHPGDTLELVEWDPGLQVETGRIIHATVLNMIAQPSNAPAATPWHHGLNLGWCILSLRIDSQEGN
jgi:hypothetical protein